MCSTYKLSFFKNCHLYFILGMFPIAMAIASCEDEEDWTWFLQHLKIFISNRRRITFIPIGHKVFYCLFEMYLMTISMRIVCIGSISSKEPKKILYYI